MEQQTRTKVLLVGPDREAGEQLRARLHGLGYEVPAVAETDDDALAKIKETWPDVLVLDWQGGALDPLRIAEQVRRTCGIPVLCLAPESVKGRCGADDPVEWIPMPVPDARLFGAIEVALYKHRTERKLRQKEVWLSAMLRCAGDGVIITNALGRIEFMNPTAERLTGYSASEAAGRELSEVLQLESSPGRSVHTDLVRLAILHGSAMGLGSNLTLISKTGAERQIEGEIALSEADGAIVGTVITFRDVTIRKWEDEQYWRHQKMRAMGRLAGGIGHDLNNLLTLILGYSDQLVKGLPPEHELHAPAQQIGDAGNVAVSMTRQLLSLARTEVFFPKPLNLTSVVEDLRPTLARSLRPQIRITTDLEPRLGTVRADPEQMQLMIVNLVLHAHRRMHDSGTIHIVTENLEVMPEERGRKIQHYVKLSVSDTGPPLDREEIEHLFDPPPPGITGRASAGSELFIVLSILNHADGRIAVKSRPGIGTSFEVLLPREQEEHLITRPLGAAMTIESAKPTILVVEDDPDVRTLLQNYFHRSGYHLLEARNGEEALMIADLHEGAIDLLIADVTMPLMSGPDLVRAMAPRRPEMRVLFISGYPQDFTGLEGFLRRGAHFLQKPFRQNELLLRVKQILREGRTNLN